MLPCNKVILRANGVNEAMLEMFIFAALVLITLAWCVMKTLSSIITSMYRLFNSDDPLNPENDALNNKFAKLKARMNELKKEIIKQNLKIERVNAVNERMESKINKLNNILKRIRKMKNLNTERQNKKTETKELNQMTAQNGFGIERQSKESDQKVKEFQNSLHDLNYGKSMIKRQSEIIDNVGFMGKINRNPSCGDERMIGQMYSSTAMTDLHEYFNISSKFQTGISAYEIREGPMNKHVIKHSNTTIKVANEMNEVPGKINNDLEDEEVQEDNAITFRHSKIYYHLDNENTKDIRVEIHLGKVTHKYLFAQNNTLLKGIESKSGAKIMQLLRVGYASKHDHYSVILQGNADQVQDAANELQHLERKYNDCAKDKYNKGQTYIMSGMRALEYKPITPYTGKVKLPTKSGINTQQLEQNFDVKISVSNPLLFKPYLSLEGEPKELIKALEAIENAEVKMIEKSVQIKMVEERKENSINLEQSKIHLDSDFENKKRLSYIVCRHGERLDDMDPSWYEKCFKNGTYVQPTENPDIYPASVPYRKNMHDYDLDTPLTARGMKEAEELGRRIRESGTNISSIYCSPAFRCILTAMSIAKGAGLADLKINVEQGLYEWTGYLLDGIGPLMTLEELLDYGINVSSDYSVYMNASDIDRKELLKDFISRQVSVTKHCLDDDLSKGGNGTVLMVAHKLSVRGASRVIADKKDPGGIKAFWLSEANDYLCHEMVQKRNDGEWQHEILPFAEKKVRDKYWEKYDERRAVYKRYCAKYWDTKCADRLLTRTLKHVNELKKRLKIRKN